mgnify:CR=1 FL=1
MDIINKKSIFTSMLQDGTFAVGDMPPFVNPFSQEAKELALRIQGNQLLRTKYRAVRNQIFELLGISTFDEILSLIHEKRPRDKTIAAAHQLLGNMFGINGIASSMVLADSAEVIFYFIIKRLQVRKKLI